MLWEIILISVETSTPLDSVFSLLWMVKAALHFFSIKDLHALREVSDHQTFSVSLAIIQWKVSIQWPSHSWNDKFLRKSLEYMHARCLVCARDTLKAWLQGQLNPNSVALLPNCLDLFASKITKLHFYGCVKILCSLNSFKNKMSKHGQSWEPWSSKWHHKQCSFGHPSLLLSTTL